MTAGEKPRAIATNNPGSALKLRLFINVLPNGLSIVESAAWEFLRYMLPEDLKASTITRGVIELGSSYLRSAFLVPAETRVGGPVR
jgi:hypothetical protein